MASLVKAIFVFVCIECLYLRQILGDVIIADPGGNEEVSVVEGEDLTLTCSSGSEDEVEWSQNGMPVARINSSSISIVTELTEVNFISHLTISNIKRFEAGFYKCSSTDVIKAMMESHESDEIRVKVTSSQALVLSAPDFQSIEGTLTLNCTGDRQTVFIWLFNGEILVDGKDAVINNALDVYTNIQTSLLTRSSVNGPIHGEYRCMDGSGNKNGSQVVSISPEEIPSIRTKKAT